MIASVVGSSAASCSSVGTRLGLYDVLWNISSVASAAATMSSSTIAGTSPRWVNRSPVNKRAGRLVEPQPALPAVRHVRGRDEAQAVCTEVEHLVRR